MGLFEERSLWLFAVLGSSEPGTSWKLRELLYIFKVIKSKKLLSSCKPTELEYFEQIKLEYFEQINKTILDYCQMYKTRIYINQLS